jgi:RHS repeat-associated protein
VPGEGYIVDLDDLGHLNLWRLDDFSSSLAYYEIPGYQSGQWLALTLRAEGSQLGVLVDGSPVITETNSAFTQGDVGVWSYNPASAGAHRFDDIMISGLVTTTTTIDYAYDPLYRLTNATYSHGAVFTYTYDATGNRLTQTTVTNTTVYTYDDANRLVNAGGVAFTWDANGNLLNDGVLTYTYDTANRLSSVTGSGLTASYAYNGLGDRMRQVTGGVTTTYTLDLNAGLTQVLADGTNTYLYGNGRIAQFAGATPSYFLGDHLGSVRQLTNASGAVTLAKNYQPYGTMLSSSGGGASNYGFTGEWTTSFSNSELVYLRARWYASSQGRFLTKDSWPGNYSQPISYNAWLYGYGNPIKHADPTGRFPTFADVATGGAEYTCNCGWIDWDHVFKSADISQGLVDSLTFARGSFRYDPNLTDLWATGLGIAARLPIGAFDNYAVVPNSSLSTYSVQKLATSIFMDANERFEMNQGSTGQFWSFFSEEDLPSDIIGFDIGWRLAAFSDTYERLQGEVRQLCKPVNAGGSFQNSLTVWRETYGGNTLPEWVPNLPGEAQILFLPPNAQTNWRNWYARLVTLTGRCDNGLCPGSRAWPSRFAYYPQIRIMPQVGQAWWWITEMPRYNEYEFVPSGRSNLYRLKDLGFMRPPPPPIP